MNRPRQWEKFLLVVFGILMANFWSSLAEKVCHSCLTHCKTFPNGKLDPASCDCLETNSTCFADDCFVKVELFPDESMAIIQKGCIKGLPKGSHGCHYAGQPESIHCYCSGDFCNEKLNLNFYMPKPLPTIECCECSELHEEKCPETKCLKTCQGNYCLVDFDGVEQGCGIGVPRLQNFLRLPHYPQHQGETICARYQATMSTVVHGCVCTNPSGQCNEINRTRSYQLTNVIDRKLDDQNYCYSLHQKSATPFTDMVFKQADTCEGHYCFISMTTSELVIESEAHEEHMVEQQSFVGLARPKYELLAGCLKVDDDKKITLGCTTEFTNTQEPISIHCICDSHLCNYYHLLNDAEDGKGHKLLHYEDRDDVVARPRNGLKINWKTNSGVSSSFSYFLLFVDIVCIFVAIK